MVFYRNFITEEGVEHLSNYKYQSGAYTPIDTIFNHFWLCLVEYMPRNLAPNMITLLGASSLFFSGLFFVLIDPSLSSRYPSWVYLIGAIGVFLHQTLDAIDGKQARRIKASSPLGQLLDHGLDSYIASTMAIMVCVLLGYPKDSIAFWIIAMIQTSSMYIANAVEYHTGVLETNDGIVGVTEIQLSVILAMLAHFFFDGFTFQIKLIAGFTLSDLIVLGIFLQFVHGFSGLINDLVKNKTPKSDILKVVFTISLVLIPSIFFIIKIAVLFSFDRQLYSNYNAYIIFTIGTLNSLLVCKGPFPWLLLECLIPIFGYIGLKIYGDNKFESKENEAIIFLMFAVMQVVYFSFSLTVIFKIATVLNIPILTVKSSNYEEIAREDREGGHVTDTAHFDTSI